MAWDKHWWTRRRKTESNKRVRIAEASLIALGFITQVPGGMKPTQKGLARASQVWDSIPDEDRLLLIPFLRKQLNLVFSGEEKDG